MDYESLLELAKQRRSCHKFKPEPIPDEYVDKIIEVARWAPSAANTQPWEFIVVKKEELKLKIAQFITEHRTLVRKMDLTGGSTRRAAGPGPYRVDVNTPVFIMLYGDPRTIEAYPVYTQHQRGQSNLHASLANAYVYMHLAATTLGLGSQWISATRNFYVQCLIRDLLGIPKELEIFETMAVGYPAEKIRPRPVRAKEEMVHYDYYDRTKLRTNEEAKELITSLSKR